MISLIRACGHVFNIYEIKLTNISPLKEPKDRTDYFAWVKYYSELYKHDSFTKRVRCPCARCKVVFYAHCGLDLKGKLVQCYNKESI